MMMSDKLIISTAEVFPIVQVLLREGKKVVFTVSGNSMWPLIRHNRDSVQLAALKRKPCVGDIVLFKTTSPYEHYILHRIYRIKDDVCITMGDGCLSFDPPVPLSSILGRVEKVHRGEHVISCDKLYIRLLFRTWQLLLLIRRPLLLSLRKIAKMKAVIRSEHD